MGVKPRQSSDPRRWESGNPEQEKRWEEAFDRVDNAEKSAAKTLNEIAADVRSDIANVRQDMDTLRNTLRSVQQGMAQMVTKTELNGLVRRVELVEDRATRLSDQVSAIDTRVKNVEGGIASLNQRVTALESK